MVKWCADLKTPDASVTKISRITRNLKTEVIRDGYRVGNFYPCAVLTMVKTPVKTGLGKTPKTHISWAKLGKTNFMNVRMLFVSLFCA